MQYLLAVVAAIFMCVAAFHDAAHDHHDKAGTADCAAFHSVAKASASPTGDAIIPVAGTPGFAFCLLPREDLARESMARHIAYARGPPLRS